MREDGPLRQTALLLANLPQLTTALEAGAVVVFDEERVRVRSLPLWEKLGSELKNREFGRDAGRRTRQIGPQNYTSPSPSPGQAEPLPDVASFIAVPPGGMPQGTRMLDAQRTSHGAG